MRVRERRREPFAAPDLALKAQRVRVLPAAALHHELYGVRDLPRVGVAALDQAERQSVRAEDDVRAVRLIKMRERQRYFFRDGLNVQRMIEKVFDGVRRAARCPFG